MKLILVLLAWLPLVAMARPDVDQKLGSTLADTGSAYYQFEHFELDSADGQRHYRVRLAVPTRAAPDEGYPVIYLLDGNAVLAALQEEWLAELDQRGPPLLVLIGPASDLRLDVDARVYDYTPSPHPGQPLLEDNERRRPAGGALAFLELIETRIKPQVEARRPVDRQRQTLWGHSYGGAFVLNTLFTRPQAFQRYVAASPSLWWKFGLLMQIEQTMPADISARLLIMRGRDEARARTATTPPTEASRAMAATPDDAAQQMAVRLAQRPGLTVDYRELTGLGHGPMLAASILPALLMAAEPDP